jgi:hypothetical protein
MKIRGKKWKYNQENKKRKNWINHIDTISDEGIPKQTFAF